MDAKQRKTFTGTVLRWLQDPEKEHLLRDIVSVPHSPSHTAPATKKSGRFVAHLRTIEAVSFVLAIGAILMENYFWWFVGLFCAGIVIQIAISLLDKDVGKVRFITLAFFALVLILFVFKVVIGKVYPERIVTWTEGNYPPGSDINGLVWRNGWSDMRFNVFNHSHTPLRDVDVEFAIDESIAGIKTVGELGCKVFQAGPAAQLTINYQDGHQESGSAPLGVRAEYHLLCDKLPGDTGIQVIAAVVDPISPEEMMAGKFKGLLKPKRIPAWLHFHISYRAGARPYDWSGSVNPQWIAK